MNQYLFFILVLLFSIDTHAQFEPMKPYERLEFLDPKPHWYHTFHNPEYRKLGSDGYNCFRTFYDIDPIIYDDKIYLILGHARGYTSDTYTYYLFCHDLATGESLWNTEVSIEKDTFLEIPLHFDISQDGHLIISGYKNTVLYNDEARLKNLIFYQREYDAQTGDLIALNHGDFSDEQVYKIEYFGLNSSPKMNIYGDTVHIVTSILEGNRPGYISIYLNTSGALIYEPDTILYKYNVRPPWGTRNLEVLNKDTLVFVEYNVDSTDLSYRMRYVNGRFQPINEIIIMPPQEFNIHLLGLIGIDKKKRQFLFAISSDFYQDEFLPNALLFISDFDGNILSRVRVERDDIGEHIEWSAEKGITSQLYFIDDEERVPFRFAQLTDDFDYDVIKDIYVSNKLRGGAIAYHIALDTQEIVLFNEYSYFYSENWEQYLFDNDASAISIASFSKGDFLADIISKSKEEETEEAEVSLFPNPAQSYLNIHTTMPFENLEIMNSVGQSLKAYDNKYEIDISDLSPGIYFLKLNRKNKRSIVKKVVKL
jgi:hypothetical protein